MSAEEIAVGALIVSLCSLWLSVRANTQNNKILEAEKRTELLSELRDTKIKIRNLVSKVKQFSDSELKKEAEENFTAAEGQVNSMLNIVKNGDSRKITDLETAKAYAIDLGKMISDIEPRLLNAIRKAELATEKEIGKVHEAIVIAAKATERFDETVQATDIPSERKEEYEAIRRAIQEDADRFLRSMSEYMSDVLRREEVSKDATERCNEIASEYVQAINKLHNEWEKAKTHENIKQQ